MSSGNPPPPDIYINEISDSLVAVPTSLPVFIGYTSCNYYNGQSYQNRPWLIRSYEEYCRIFCLPEASGGSAPKTKQYTPEYYLLPQQPVPSSVDCLRINGNDYSVLPDPATIYYLHNSVRLFYANGGGDAFIVSVGTYGSPSGKPVAPGQRIVNPEMKLNDLLAGLDALKEQAEPTMYICPDAVLLNADGNATLMQRMLKQCSELRTAISIFDVPGGDTPDPVKYMEDIKAFRSAVGEEGLGFGAAYYPFLNTDVMQAGEFDYYNLFGRDVQKLAELINPPELADPKVTAVFGEIMNPVKKKTVAELNDALLSISPSYVQIMQHVQMKANLLPAGGAVAGVINTVDSTEGVWRAPANVSVQCVNSLPVAINDAMQADMNVDALTGKSVNAIRNFAGMGFMIWGARTLDGNSSDWKYIPVRRTMIMLEQSCKLAVQAFAFQPNDKNTWEAVKATISSFLTSMWNEGGLQGATPADAFSVECGLGTTMASDDLLNGVMDVVVKVAVTHPDEFIVFAIQQEMQQSG